MQFADDTVVSAVYALADRELTRALIPRIREETLRLLAGRAPLPPFLLDELAASPDPELRSALVRSAGHRDDVFQRLNPGGVRQTKAGGVRTGTGTATGTGTGRFAGPANRNVPKRYTPWERHPKTTKVLIGDLRDKDFRGTLKLPGTPDAPAALDWDDLLAEHRAVPFHASGLMTLWTHPDCPEELALAAYETNRRLGGAVHWSMVTSPRFADLDLHDLTRLLHRGITAGALPVDRVLGEIRPARDVLCALPDDHEGVRAALAAQVACLGTDFAPWRAVFTLLPRFSGTVTELLDAALAEASKTSKHRGKPWPKPLKAEFPSRGMPYGREGWLRLYDVADHTTRNALVAHMDPRAIQQLLLRYRPSAELRAHIVRLRGVSVLGGIASRWDTAPEVIEELIPYNDPEVNAALFLHTDLTPAQRRHVLSGRHWRDGVSADTPAADRIRLTADLTDGLRESARRPWLLACADSGDPLLCRVLLGSPRARIHTPALELHMLIRLWERHGPDGVRELLDETDFPGRKPQPKHPLSPGSVTAGRAAVDAVAEPHAEPHAETGSAGLAVLRAAFEAAASPAGRADFLADKGAGVENDDLARALDLLAEEIGPGPVPWAELTAAHATKPLHDRLLVRLAELDGCPSALAAESAAAALRLSHPHYRPRRGAKPPTASEMLRKLPLRVDNGGCRWLERAHHLGQVTLPEIVRTGFPARAAAVFLARALAPGAEPGAAPADTPATEEIRQTRQSLAALTTEHLGDDPEGWALALRLSPDFEGTLPDLLLASGAVVS